VELPDLVFRQLIIAIPRDFAHRILSFLGTPPLTELQAALIIRHRFALNTLFCPLGLQEHLHFAHLLIAVLRAYGYPLI